MNLRRPVVYIAGPYGADTPALIRLNVARAVALGQVAAAAGLAPIVPHAMGYMGVHGDAFEDDDGTARQNAIECGIALAIQSGMAPVVRLSAPPRDDVRMRGSLWVILRDDGTMSRGTGLEAHGYNSSSGMPPAIANTWRGWCGAPPSTLEEAAQAIEQRLLHLATAGLAGVLEDCLQERDKLVAMVRELYEATTMSEVAAATTADKTDGLERLLWPDDPTTWPDELGDRTRPAE